MMDDETDTETRPDTDTDTGTGTGTGAASHPLQRAHRFFQKAVPAIREVNEAIDGGALEQVRDTVVGRATELVQKVDQVVANAAAIEGDVIERIVKDPATPAAHAGDPDRRSPLPPADAPSHRGATAARWITIGVVAAAATYGALKLQRRR